MTSSPPIQPPHGRFARALSVIAVLVLVSPLAAYAESSSTESSSAEHAAGVDAAGVGPLSDTLALFEQQKGSVLALAAIVDLASSASDWLTWEETGRLFDQLAAQAQDPRARAMLKNVAMVPALNRLELSDYRARLHAAGYLTQWSFIGPFPNDGMAGMRTTYGPEEDGFVPTKQYDGKRQTVQWRELPTTFESGFMPVGDYVEPSDASVVYAVTEFRTARAAEGYLSVAIDGAYKLWFNGDLVADVDQHLGGFVLRDEIPVRVRDGVNRIAIKIGSAENSPGFHVRLLDRRHRLIDAKDRHPQTELPDIMKGEASADAAPVRFVSDWVREALGPEENWSDDDRVYAAYIVKSLSGEDSTQAWLAWLSGVDAAGLSEPALQRFIALRDQHWRQEEAVARFVPADAGAGVTAAAIAVRAAAPGVDGSEARRAGLTDMQRRFPDDVRTKLLEIDVLKEAGMTESVFARALALTAQYPNSARALSILADAASNADRPALRARALEQLARNHPFSVAMTQYGALALRQTGQGERAEELFARAEPIHRNDINFLTAWTHWRRADGDHEGAKALLERAIALNPTSARLHRMLAQVHLEGSAHEAAIAELELALQYFPQDSSSRRLLRFLQEHEDDFYKEWQIPIDEIVALKAPAEDERMDYRALVNQKITRVYDNGLATAYVQQAWQVYSREGADALRAYGIGYTPDSERVEILGVRVVKADGTERRLFESRDYDTQSGPAAIYYDVRRRSVYVPTLEEGDVLMLEYTIEDVAYRNIFDDYFGDLWFAGSYAPTALARYGVLMPTSRPLETRVANHDGEVAREVRGDETLYVFETTDLPDTTRESYAPGSAELLPYVHVSTYSDWDTLGRWYWNLVKDQLVISPEISAAVAELTAGVEDRRAKVAAIHNYVVRNTRYVGLEFGIHGFKPYTTTECFNRRFGDCKDTASLMKVMLESAGIPARLVLVRTRDLGNVDGRPPSLALFNHAIAYVPEFDLYLDGTAGYSGSTELPSLDQGATAVIIEDGAGAELTTIPFLPASDNVATTETTLVWEDTSLRGDYRYTTAGSGASSLRRNFESEENRKESLESWFSSRTPGATIRDVQVENLTDIERPASVAFAFEGGQWGVVGDAWRLPVVGREIAWLSGYSRTSSRELPLVLGTPSTSIESFTLVVPDDIDVLQAPDGRVIESPWGRFSLTVDRLADGRMGFHAEATLTMQGGTVSPEDYPEFRRFALDVQRVLTEKFVLDVPDDFRLGAGRP